MATGEQVLGYRAAGHSVSATAAHYGISESRVYQLAREARRAQRVEVEPRLFPQPADDVAGDETYWRCPVCQELKPVVPGSRRHAWMEDQKRLHRRVQASQELAGDPGGDRQLQLESTAAVGGAGMEGASEASESVITPVATGVMVSIAASPVRHNVVRAPVDRSTLGVNTLVLLQVAAEQYRLLVGLVVAVLLVGLCVSAKVHAMPLR